MSKARDIADLDFNSPDIDGGNIDGATIGASTAAAGTFTGLTVNGSGERQYINSGHIRLTDGYNIEWGGGTNFLRGYNSTGGMALNATGNLTIDVVGDIELNADGGDWLFKDGSVNLGSIQNDGNNNFIVMSNTNNKSIKFLGIDNSNTVTALLLDMENAGAATFNSTVTSTGFNVNSGGSLAGSIGKNGSRPYFASTNCGIRLGAADLLPATSSGAVSDNVVSLGSSSGRWKDLYLSGKVRWYSGSAQKAYMEYDGTNVVQYGASGVGYQFWTGGQRRVDITSGGDLSLATDGAELQLYYTEPRTFITNSGASVKVKQIDNDTTNAFIDFTSWTDASLMRIMNTGEQSRKIFGGGHRYEIEMHRSAPAVSQDFTISSNTGSNNSFGVVLKIINTRYNGGLGHSTWIIQGDLPGGSQNAVYRSVNGTDAGSQSISISNVGLSSSSVVFRITMNDSYSDLFIEATTFAYSSHTCTLSY